MQLPAQHSCLGHQVVLLCISLLLIMLLRTLQMSTSQQLSPAKRKRLLKTYGPCPAGYTHQDLGRFLDLLYGLYSYLYTPEELRQIIVSDPFDHSEPPRSLKLVDLAAW